MALSGGIVLKEVVDLSSDRLMMMIIPYHYKISHKYPCRCHTCNLSSTSVRDEGVVC
jgi:hypothetical protein